MSPKEALAALALAGDRFEQIEGSPMHHGPRIAAGCKRQIRRLLGVCAYCGDPVAPREFVAFDPTADNYCAECARNLDELNAPVGAGETQWD